MSDRTEQDQRHAAVLAKLNRVPQDEFQAAVVLEAWGGSKAPDSFAGHRSAGDVGGDSMPMPRTRRQSIGQGRWGELGAIVIVVLSAIVWVPLLSERFGEAVLDGVGWGLPLALALDASVRSRYLGSGNVRSLWRGGRSLMVLELATVLAGLGLALRFGVQTEVVVALSLAMVWGHVSVLSTRRWVGAYALLVLAITGGLVFSPYPLIILVGGAVSVVGLALVGVATASEGVVSTPQGWRVGALAAIVGGGIGVLLTADRSVVGVSTWSLALALGALTLAGWLASIRLSRLWLELPEHLQALTLGHYSASASAVSSAFWRTTMSSVGVVVIATVALVGVSLLDGAATAAGVLISYGLFTLATLIVSLNLVSRSWMATAAIVVVAAVLALVLARLVPGFGLAAGSGFVIVVGGALAAFTFRDAVVVFSTRMMIQ